MYLALAVGALLTGGIAHFSQRMSQLSMAMLLVAAAALMSGWTHYRARLLPEDHIVLASGPEAQLATLRGRVATSPTIRPPAAHWQEPSTMLLLEVESILTRDGDWMGTSGLVRVIIDEPMESLHSGMDVELLCWLGRYGPARNPGQYDPIARAQLDRVFVWARVRSAEAVTVLDRRSGILPTLDRWIGWLRIRSRQRLVDAPDLEGMSGGQITQALILGERNAALASLNDTMRRAGIAHFLSISGLHLAVFLGFVYGLCRLLLLSPRRSAVVVLVVLGCYLLLAEPRAPLLRSAVMAAMVAVAVITRRAVSPGNALAAAGILLLCIDPLELFSAGFQLSFLIVAALIAFHGPLKRRLFGWLYRRRGLMVYRDADSRRRRVVRLAVDGLINAAVLSLTAYLAAAPLAAMHFGLFSPYAVVLSLLLFPLVAAVLIPGYLALLLAAVAPNLSTALASLAGWLAGALAAVVGWAESLPGLHVDLQPLGVGWLIATVASLGLVALGLRRSKRWLLAATSAGAFLLIAATAWTQLPAGKPPVAQLDLLSVGSGQLAVLRLPSGPTVLMDGGSILDRDLAGNVLRPFLLDHRLPWPRVAFVSHGNVDHYSVVEDLADSGQLDVVYLGEYFGREGLASQGEMIFLKVLAEAGVEIRRLKADQTVQLDERTSVEVLWPGPAALDAQRRVGNELSMVLRVTCDQRSLILPGDIESVGLAALADRAGGIAADVLVLPHHGSWREQLPAFVEAVDPQIVLVSRGRALAKTGQAGGFFAELARRRRLLSTGQVGWIRVRFGQGLLEVVDTAR